MNDIVIPLGKGSKWANNELRYCLRSVEAHLKNFGKLFIVGEFPDWLNSEAMHIPQPFSSGNAARNIAMNLLEACRDERLSEKFAYLNDEYFLTSQIDATDYPAFYKCDLSHTLKINHTDYRRHVRITLDTLKVQGFGTLNFDCHYPTIFEKQKLRQVIEANNFDTPFGLILKSLYFNTYQIAGVHRLDCKQVYIKTLQKWREYVKTTECFSIHDTVINPAFKEFMSQSYPDKSRWEK